MISRRLLAIASAFLLATGVSHADGGAVLAQQKSGPYLITLFGSPAPLRAGPADLSVFVQDAKTGEAVFPSRIDLQVQASGSERGEAWVPPCCSMKKDVKTVSATREAAQNKLLFAAMTIIPASGEHQILVRLDDEDVLKTSVDVATAPPPLSTYWAYLAFPPLAIVGFAINQRLRRRAN